MILIYACRFITVDERKPTNAIGVHFCSKTISNTFRVGVIHVIGAWTLIATYCPKL